MELRANLHAHTTLSDGVLDPQEVVDTYAGRGYDCLAITDHDRLAEPGLIASLDPRGMLLIPGNEITADGPHILHVNAGRWVPPQADRQAVLDQAAGAGGFTLMNHPNWEKSFDHCPMSVLEALHGYTGIEVFNGVVCRQPGSPYATGKWDMLLSAGRSVWGFANDDFHRPGDLALGWNVAFCRERTVAGLLRAFTEGSFYATTGVTILRIAVQGTRITVETRDAQSVVAMADHGRRIATGQGPSLAVEAPADAGYVRFECHGSGLRVAWTQPFFVQGQIGDAS